MKEKIENTKDWVKRMIHFLKYESTPRPYIELFRSGLLEKLEAIDSALAELEKPGEEDLPCFLITCQFYDKEFPENCVAESGGEPAIATCVKYLKASKIVIDYHAKKCAECKKACEWVMTDEEIDNHIVYETSCGHKLIRNRDDECPKCGHKIEVVNCKQPLPESPHV